jgi:hypothetical protein
VQFFDRAEAGRQLADRLQSELLDSIVTKGGKPLAVSKVALAKRSSGTAARGTRDIDASGVGGPIE